MGYVGNHAEHVMASRQFNPAIYTADAPLIRSATKPPAGSIPAWARSNWPTPTTMQMTNAAEVNVTRRSAHGLTLLSNVVWMKTIDNGSSGTEGQAGPPNPFNLQSSRGVADFDQALRITGSVNYPMPQFHVNSIAGAIVNGWQANAIVTSQSGLPITHHQRRGQLALRHRQRLRVYVPGVSIARPAGASKTASGSTPRHSKRIRYLLRTATSSRSATCRATLCAVPHTRTRIFRSSKTSLRNTAFTASSRQRHSTLGTTPTSPTPETR